MPDAWIRQWGDPALHERASVVRTVDELMRRQVRRMQERLLDADGVGLAATQVGIMQRLFVYRWDADSPVEVLVNPRIVDASAERSLFGEGCLSFNHVTVAVERASAVRVEGQDLDGKDLVFGVEGYRASLMQHEIDHLDGILTLDRAEPEERWRVFCELLEAERLDPALAA
jgi:peptide deformylase